MKRRRLFTIEKLPGPSDYDVEGGRNLPPIQAPFGTRGPRSVYVTNSNPSPVDYQVEVGSRPRDLGIAPFLSRGPRFERVRQNNPHTSPGQYELGITDEARRARLWDIASPVFKMANDRNPFPVRENAPGPGEYSPDRTVDYQLKRCMDGIERSKPGTFIGQEIKKTPGPGAYEVDGEKVVGGGYIRQGERRLFDLAEKAPPPGTYEVAGSFVKPSFNRLFPVAME
jgi:hypothetical protein